VLETALDSIITIDRHGCVLDFNPAAEKTFGYTRAEVLGREMAEIIIPESFRDRHRAGLKRAVETGADTMIGRRIELTALRRSGEEFAVDLALARINTKDGPIFTAHIQDISERKRAETQRERALAHEKELSELKSRFVSMVSHEFRTPLGIITSSADILDAYLERLTPDERQSNIRDITDATRQMSRMMEEVLLLGRVEAGKMTCRPAPLDLAMFCQRLVDEVNSATSSRCPIHLATTPGMPEAMADESLLRHIFTNLINNAIKYSPIASPVEFRVEARDHLAVFTVSDRGIGIPAEDAHLLFQAFHRGRNVGDRPGTGLGMTVVKRCVELHGGRIAFESTEGRGTTLVVALPLFGAGPSPNGDGTTTFIRAAARGRNLTFVS
jgi:PAS domain S-box-containing protein